ncbi:hypothetical protein [Granulicella sp. L60]
MLGHSLAKAMGPLVRWAA